MIYALSDYNYRMAHKAQVRRIAANVRVEVARQHKTQAQLAHKLGITQPAMSRRMLGHVPFTGDELATIAAELDIPISILIDTEAAS